MDKFDDNDIVDPAPKVRKSIKIGARSYNSGELQLIARLVVSPDGRIILSTPWESRSGLFLSEFEATERGALSIKETTLRVGESGVGKCHYHRSGFTSVQSQEGGKRLSVNLAPLSQIHAQQFAYIYTKFPGMLPIAPRLRKYDPMFIEDRPGMKSISVHIAAYKRSRVSSQARGRVDVNFPLSFASRDRRGFFVDGSATGLDVILGFFFRESNHFPDNTPDCSMNMFNVTHQGFDGAIGLQTERSFAGLGRLDRVPPLSLVNDQRTFAPIQEQYPMSTPRL